MSLKRIKQIGKRIPSKQVRRTSWLANAKCIAIGAILGDMAGNLLKAAAV